MRVRTLISALPSDTRFDYQGDEETVFGGISVNHRSTEVSQRFFAMTPRTLRRLPQREDEGWDAAFANVVRRMRRGGVNGFICPLDMRGHSALEGLNCFFVEEPYAFVLRAVSSVRDSRGARRITAVTGSAGKSTTKQMITHALTAIEAAKRIQSPPNPQNLFISLVGHLSRSHLYGHSVLEVAGSCLQEMEHLDFSVSADVSIVTSISEAHLNYLRNLEGVARYKANIFRAPPAGGTAVINLDAPHSDLLVRRAVSEGCQLVTYGESEEATIRLVDYDAITRTVTARVGREELTYVVGAHGRHMALNSLAVIATLRAYRLSRWREGVASLESFAPLTGRGEITEITTPEGVPVTLIDEAYNANPGSMSASLRSLAERPAPEGGRKIAVLGDILELGSQAETLHIGLADAVEATSADELHLFGEHMGALHRRLTERGIASTHYEDLPSLTRGIRSTLRPGDLVLVKSSHGTGLHALVSELKAEIGPDDQASAG